MNPMERRRKALDPDARIADVLVLCMTRGMSLTAWESSGVLEREWALYERLGKRYGKVVIASYASGPDEATLAERLHADVVFNASGLPPERYIADLPAMVCDRLRSIGATSAVVKTNQFEGGDAAVSIIRRLCAGGTHATLIARGGYPWSRFEGWKHGADSPQAIRAAAEEGDLCRNADLVIGTTSSMVEDLGWRYAIRDARLRVVPNYVQSLPFPRQSVKSPHPSTGAPVVLAAGRLEDQKRFGMLIHAFATSGIADDAILSIVGDGPLRDTLAQQAERECVRLDLPGRMRHADLIERMRNCALFVQCSAFEGHPKTVLEAMGTGACVLVTDTPGLGTVIRHNETGWVVADSENELSSAIAILYRDEPKRRSLGDKAWDIVSGRLDVGEIVQEEARHHAWAHMRSTEAKHAKSVGVIRWEPALLHAPRHDQTEAWRQSINGFARRLSPRERVAFLLSLDDPIYQLQGPAAIEVEQHPGGPPGGIHPKHRLMRYHDFFVDRIKHGERVIDLGSGVGALAASIALRCNATVTGLELEPANIAKANAIAQQQGIAARVNYTLGDITTHRAALPPGGAFDVVVLSNVLEHIKNRPAMLRQWAQWYSPSRFLIRVPAFDRDWKVPFKKELGVEWRLDDTHELEYTAETLEAELREAGMEITETIVRWGEYWVSARPSPWPEEWASIRMLVFDFDGVMSNNQVLVMQDGTEGVLCNRSDGLGIEMLRKAAAVRDAAAGAGQPPFSMLVLSKEVNPVVAARCKKLKLECHQGVDDKLPHLQRLAGERGVVREQVAYVGNDVNDVACMQWAGLPIAVNDAFPACKAAARLVTTAPGGQGAVREVCERIIDGWRS
jgi:YrbI family 3-deoxy-D-manno-octulosonate 8-phosphate phosphatase